jgi:hypothetical protein
MKSSIDKKKIKFEVEKLSLRKEDILVVRVMDEYVLPDCEFKEITRTIRKLNIENYIIMLYEDRMIIETFTLEKFKEWSKEVIKGYKKKQCKVNK